MAEITMADIEKAIDEAAAAIKDFEGSRTQLIAQVIHPLQATLTAGVKAGLKCTEQAIRSNFRKLEKALREFDERPSERAMRLSEPE